MLPRIPSLLASVTTVSVLACASELGPMPPAAAPPPADQAFRVEATVRWLSIENGCWVLATANGRYQPVDLPVGYRVEGRTVSAKLRGAPDMVTTCMAGPLVHVDSIARR